MPAPLNVTSGDLYLVACTLYGEARGEPEEGQIAVAWVIRNRAEDPGWWTVYTGPSNADGRITHVGGACVKPYQFSCWLPDDPNYKTVQNLNPISPDCIKLREIGRRVMAGEIEDPTGGATHYINPAVLAKLPAWAEKNTPTKTIGNHHFYKIGRTG